MKIRSTIIILAIFTMIVGLPAFGKGKGDVPAPTDLLVVVGADDIDLSWTPGVVDEPGEIAAEKFSVDIEGIVTYNDGDDVDGDGDGEPLDPEVMNVQVSFGTSDRTDGLPMSDPTLTISIEDLAAAIAAELGVDAEDILLLDGEAKVKGLALGNGRQNNDFSVSVECDVDFED